jgi:hypothetical protein
MSTTDAIQAIERYVRLCGCEYSQWCAGVAADPVDRLLREHGVAEEGDGCGWITFHCVVPELARAARDHFIARGMMAASPAEGDGAAASVYVFRVTTHTRG